MTFSSVVPCNLRNKSTYPQECSEYPTCFFIGYLYFSVNQNPQNSSDDSSETIPRKFRYTTKANTIPNMKRAQIHQDLEKIIRHDNVVTFLAPSSNTITPVEFNIYKDANLVHELTRVEYDGKKKYRFVDEDINPKEKHSYFIIADYGDFVISKVVKAKKINKNKQKNRSDRKCQPSRRKSIS